MQHKPSTSPFTISPLDQNGFWKDLQQRIQRHDSVGLACEMAYHFLLASGPGIVCILALLSLFTDAGAISREFVQFAGRFLPRDAVSVLWQLIEKVLQGGSGGLALFSFLGALWASSNGAATLIKALRRAYNLTEDERDMKRMGFVRQRLFSLAMVLFIALVLFWASNLFIWSDTIMQLLSPLELIQKNQEGLFRTIKWSTAFFILMGFATLVYKLVPGHEDSTLRWRQAFIGAFIFVIIWGIASLGFTIYVDNFGSYNEVYGSLGAFIVLTLWLQLSSLAFLLGGEVTALLDKYNVMDPERPTLI
jgi:membrane protein